MGKKLWKATQTKGGGGEYKLSYRLTFDIHKYLKSLNKIAYVITRGSPIIHVSAEFHSLRSSSSSLTRP